MNHILQTMALIHQCSSDTLPDTSTLNRHGPPKIEENRSEAVQDQSTGAPCRLSTPTAEAQHSSVTKN